jgi:(1->4)-alpha-D-glucan 1-alpha-D-glucosylmutase
MATLTDGGRVWPTADAFDATIMAPGYAVEGVTSRKGVLELPVAGLFSALPVALLKARSAPVRPRSTRLQ